MKKLLFLFTLIITNSVYSQNLTIFSVDTSKFPIMRGKFYAYDNTGNQLLGLSPIDFELTENNTNREITFISCPTPKPPQALSSVLTIDVSGSMSSSRLEQAKAAARTWINAMPSGKSECAITSFDYNNYLNQDFTKDKSKLLEATESLKAKGGTDFDAALIKPMAGSLLIAEQGKNKKVIVLLTDGQAVGNEQAIIEKANHINAVIYCVILGTNCPPILKNIAEKTGGQWFERITTESEAKEIYMQILLIAQSLEPCTIEWLSDDDCDDFRDVLLTLKSNNTLTDYFYIAPTRNLAQLEFTPSTSMKFGIVSPPFSETKEITLTARNKGIKINSVELTNPQEFEIVDWDGDPPPFVIIKNRSRNIKVKYKPLQTGYSFSFCRFEIDNNACIGKSFFAAGGILDKELQTGTLKLTFPNGDETFVAGSDTIVTWSGIFPEDTVSLDYSTDNGKNWVNITNSASNLKYNWLSIPNTPSQNCLMKVIKKASISYKAGDLINLLGLGVINQIAYSPNSNMLAVAVRNRVVLVDLQTKSVIRSFTGHQNMVLSVAFNPNGELIASSSNDGTVRVWDVNSGIEVITILVDTDYINSVAFSPDGKSIATGCGDNKIRIWNVNAGKLIKELQGHSSSVFSIAFSPDGNQLVSGSFDNKIKLWDIVTGSISQTFSGHSGWVNSVVFSPDGSRIASGSTDRTVKLWLVKTGKLLHTFTNQYYGFKSVTFNPNGKTLYGGSTNGTVFMWSVQYGTEIRTYPSGNNNIAGLAVSADGLNLAVASLGEIKIFDAVYGNELFSLSGHTSSINSVALNPDNSLIASTGDDGLIKFWDFKTGWSTLTLSGKSY